jgi:hypothetical protein
MAAFALPVSPDGEVLPHDHPGLVGDRLIRRISPDHIVDDQNAGCRRISSALFKIKPKQGYLSFDAEGCISGRGHDPAAFVRTPPWCGALIISIELFRSFDTADQGMQRWKIGMVPLDDNPCHGAVWGGITKGQSNDIQRASEWLVGMPGVEKLHAD